MRNTKRLTALALAILMVLTLAACSGGSDTDAPSGNDPGTQQTPNNVTPTDNGGTPTDNGGNGPSPTDNGGTADSTPGNGGDDIPDNGTPPDVPAPFESHAGDKGYFYVTTDDYIVWIDTNAFASLTYGDKVAVYKVVSFDENGAGVGYHYKYVFKDIADAGSHLRGHYIQIDNVFYRNPAPPPDAPGLSPNDIEHNPLVLGVEKDTFIADLQRNGYDHYISKP